MRLQSRAPSIGVVLFLNACGPGPSYNPSESTTTSSSSEPTSNPESSTETATDPQTETESETGDCDAGITDPTGANCDTLNQYCAEGDKCVPLALTSETWNDYACVPVVGAGGRGCRGAGGGVMR